LKFVEFQLTEANQRWSNEWNKLVAHYDSRINDLQTERDRLAKEMTENKISEEAKLRDFEKMLMNSKKKSSEEEVCLMILLFFFSSLSK
jgi:predicted transcriptional regulator